MLTEKLSLIAAIILASIVSYRSESEFISDFILLMTGLSIGMLIVFIKRPEIIGK